MSYPVKVGVVGLGRWARVLTRAARRGQRLEVVCGYSQSQEKREAFAREFGCRVVDSLEELLADPEVEGVMVTTPNDAHAQPIIQAAQAGKHVYVDKPIAHTIADGLRIAQAVRQAGVVFAVGHSARRLAGIRHIKKALEQGDVGELVMAEANFSNERGLELTPQSWRWYSDKSPGGPLIQLGVHHVDALRYLFGPIRAVLAMKKRLYTRAEVEDVTMTLLEFEAGHLGYVGSAWACPGVFFVNVYGTRANYFYEVNFKYWEQSHLIDDHAVLTRQTYGEMERRPVTPERTDMLREQLEEWATCIREGGRPEVGAEEALEALAVIWAAIRSAQEGRRVELHEILSSAAA